MNWEDSLKYCEGLSLGGKDDWRLPNIKELMSMGDATLIYPSMDKEVFPTVKGANNYWSSSTEGKHTTKGWKFGAGFGIAEYSEKTESLNVRCVRGGNSLPR